MENILVSACLLGVNCRYNGAANEIEVFGESQIEQLLERILEN